MNLIIRHLLCRYNSLPSLRNQVFVFLCLYIYIYIYIKTEPYDVITRVLFDFNLFTFSTPPIGIVILYVKYMLPFTMNNIKFQLNV